MRSICLLLGVRHSLLIFHESAQEEAEGSTTKDTPSQPFTMMILRYLLLLLLPVVAVARGFNIFHIDTTDVEAGAFGGGLQEEDAPRPRFQRRRTLNRGVGGGSPQLRSPLNRGDGGAASKRRPQQKKMNMNMKRRQQEGRSGSPQASVISPVVSSAISPVISEKAEDKPGFDFVVAGFPKCGTTTLLKAFGAHEETDMASSEQCAVASPGQADAKVQKLLDGTLATLSTDPAKKRSFKCPTAMYNYKTIARMEKHSPNTKFVVGMRHPVKMLQSFYNYRITEIKERGLDEPIPLLDEVLESGMPWKGVSMQSTRFELFLIQMGKTTVTPEQMKDLVGQNYDLAIFPTNFTVFLYTVDQLEDSDEERSKNLRKEMQDYLGLSAPIEAFGHENKNHAVGASSHTELIAICDDKFAPVRAKLVEQGAKTAEWLRDHFILSEDVVVANHAHFVQTLQSWGTDPCHTAVE
jgi:hypothetical protein